jgi:5'-deoxynucleotidase YfbR-like HD superfamily hydrolase
MSDHRWIQTYTGRCFFPLNPEVSAISIVDIAHALSMKCRFGGHCNSFYSVAQHSIEVANLIAPASDRVYGLLHDAAEAYLPDVCSPIKRDVYVTVPPSDVEIEFNFLEERLLSAVARRFKLDHQMLMTLPKEADRIMLATEQRDIMGKCPQLWPQTLNVTPREEVVKPISPPFAKMYFLEAFRKAMKDFNDRARATTA